MTQRFQVPWWYRFQQPPQGQHPPPPQGTPGAGPGAPPPWFAGMAPRAVPPYQWPHQPPMGGEDGAGSPAEGGVSWADVGQRERPRISEWRPPEEELSRWGVERELPKVAAGVSADTIGPQELIRLTMPIPTGVTCMVWARQLGGAPAVEVLAQVMVGIGSIQVPVTPWVLVTLDGVARFLGPRDAAAPATVASLPLVMPAKWVSVNFKMEKVALDESTLIVGAMAAPISAIG